MGQSQASSYGYCSVCGTLNNDIQQCNCADKELLDHKRYFADIIPETKAQIRSLLSGWTFQDQHREHRTKPQEQIGGTHYSSKAIQPIEYIEANNLGFLEANIVKYITRWKDKNGVEDLKKAKWYLDRLISNNSNKGD